MDEICLRAEGVFSCTTVPNEFIDRYMIDANGEYVKIYIYLLRHLNSVGSNLNLPELAERLYLTGKEIRRALIYWSKKGLIGLEEDEYGNLSGIVLKNQFNNDTYIPAREREPQHFKVNSELGYNVLQNFGNSNDPFKVGFPTNNHNLENNANSYLGEDKNSTTVSKQDSFTKKADAFDNQLSNVDKVQNELYTQTRAEITEEAEDTELENISSFPLPLATEVVSNKLDTAIEEGYVGSLPGVNLRKPVSIDNEGEDVEADLRELFGTPNEELSAKEEAGLKQDKVTSFIAKDSLNKVESDKNIKTLLTIAEQYIGRTLSSTDIRSIIKICDTMGLGVTLTEYLIGDCVSKNHNNLHYIESVAERWKASGITTVEQAKLASKANNQEYYEVLRALGFNNISLTRVHINMIDSWRRDLGFSMEIILKACDKTVLSATNPTFQYVDAILKSWAAAGVTTIDDIDKLDKNYKKGGRKVTKAKAVSGLDEFGFPQREYDYDQLEIDILNK